MHLLCWCHTIQLNRLAPHCASTTAPRRTKPEPWHSRGQLCSLTPGSWSAVLVCRGGAKWWLIPNICGGCHGWFHFKLVGIVMICRLSSMKSSPDFFRRTRPGEPSPTLRTTTRDATRVGKKPSWAKLSRWSLMRQLHLWSWLVTINKGVVETGLPPSFWIEPGPKLSFRQWKGAAKATNINKLSWI